MVPLFNLLPGFRDLRAPLAAGSLWLLAIWLALPSVPDRAHATGVWRRILELDDVLSALGTGAAIGFAAYILGSLSETVIAAAVAAVNRARTQIAPPKLPEQFRITSGTVATDLAKDWTSTEVLSKRGRNSLEEFILRAVEPLEQQAIRTEPSAAAAMSLLYPGVKYLHIAAGEILALNVTDAAEYGRAELLHTVKKEFPLVRLRLLSTAPEVFSEIDRLRSEAELREAIALPLLALAVVLGTQVDEPYAALGWLFLGVITVVLLLWQAHLKRRGAGDALVDALVIGRVEAPAIEQLKAELGLVGSRREETEERKDPPLKNQADAAKNEAR